MNSCDHYMFSTKRSHKFELKRLTSYLKHTKDHGLVLNSNYYVCKVDAFPDANFSGMYGYKKPTYPACVKSRTVFIIKVSDCPVLWVSKLQTKNALVTMEAEITAMNHCCREMLTIVDIDTSLGKAVDITMGDTRLNISVH